MAYAYLRACDREDISEDGWSFDALLEAGDGRGSPLPSIPPSPAATWEEHDARRRVVESTVEATRARGVTLAEDVTLRLLAWIHDIRGWNA